MIGTRDKERAAGSVSQKWRERAVAFLPSIDDTVGRIDTPVFGEMKIGWKLDYAVVIAVTDRWLGFHSFGGIDECD